MGRAQSGLHEIDRCVTRSGPSLRTVWRTPNHQESFLRQTRDQPFPWHGKTNKASPIIVILRTVTAYRLEKFCVDYKMIKNIHIHINFIQHIITHYITRTSYLPHQWITNFSISWVYYCLDYTWVDIALFFNFTFINHPKAVNLR